MRIALLCSLVLLCGAETALAQQYPGYPNYGNYQPNPASGYYGYPPYSAPQPAYGSYGYPRFNTPQQVAVNPSYGYVQGAQAFQAAPAPQASPANGGYPVAPNPYMQAPAGGYPTAPNPYMQAPAGGYPTAANPYVQAPAGGYPTAANPYMQAPAGNGGLMLPPSPYVQPNGAAGVPPYTSGTLASGTPVTLEDHGGVSEAHHTESDPSDFWRPTNERFWVSADYMMSWLKPARSGTPLVTTGSPQDVHTGALGQPGTVVLYGDKNIDFGLMSGIKGEVGFFLDSENHFSLDAAGLYVFQKHETFNLSSDSAGNPTIARPVVNAINGNEVAFVDSLPGLAAGAISVDSTTELIGGELNLCFHAYGLDHVHIDGLFGFRYLRLAESLTIQDQLQPLVDNALTFNGGFVNSPNSLADQDQFRTINNFYGLQLGGRITWEQEWFFVSAYWKFAAGATDQEVDIAGSTTMLSPGGNQVASGGILALPTNIGNHTQTVFGFVPEAGFTVGINVTKHIQLTAGYTCLYWNQVVRPQSQIDRVVNPTQVPSDASFGQATGPARPVFGFNDEAFWMNSFSFGLGIHY